FELIDLGSIRVKGKSRPIPVVALAGEVVAETGMDQDGQAPLLGREAEIEQIERALAEVEDGRGRTLMLSGEPGIGKSRLLREVDDLSRGPGWQLSSAACQFRTA